MIDSMNGGNGELNEQISKAFFMARVNDKLLPAVLVNEGLGNLAMWITIMSEHGYSFKPVTDLEEEVCRTVPCAGCKAVGQPCNVLMFNGGGVVENLMLCHQCGMVSDLIGGGQFWIQPFYKCTEAQMDIVEISPDGIRTHSAKDSRRHLDILLALLKRCMLHRPIASRTKVLRRVVEAENMLQDLVIEFEDFEEWLDQKE